MSSFFHLHSYVFLCWCPTFGGYLGQGILDKKIHETEKKITCLQIFIQTYPKMLIKACFPYNNKPTNSLLLGRKGLIPGRVNSAKQPRIGKPTVLQSKLQNILLRMYVVVPYSKQLPLCESQSSWHLQHSGTSYYHNTKSYLGCIC